MSLRLSAFIAAATLLIALVVLTVIGVDTLWLFAILASTFQVCVLLALAWAVFVALKLYAERTAQVRRVADAAERLADGFGRDAPRG